MFSNLPTFDGHPIFSAMKFIIFTVIYDFFSLYAAYQGSDVNSQTRIWDKSVGQGTFKYTVL